MLLGQLERNNAIARFENGVATSLQILRDQLANILFVFHKQNGFSAGRRGGGLLLRNELFGRGGDARQVDLERRPVADFAVDPDVAAALFHDAINGGESKTRTAAGPFGRKERLEN